MSETIQGAPESVGPDGEDHRFQAERKRRTSKTAILVIVAFVVTMAAVGGGVMLAKSYIRDYQQQREEKRREKERLAKVEQQRAKKVFAAPGTLPAGPAASVPHDEVPAAASPALPVNFGATKAQPIEVKDTVPRQTGTSSAMGSSRSGQSAPPPPPPATMMLSGDQAGRAVAANPTPSARAPDAGTAPPEDGATAYKAKMDQLLASANGAPAGRGTGQASALGASAPAAGPVVIPRGVGRSTVQDYARVNAARTAITSTPQATAAMLGDRSLLLARGAFIPCTLETQLFSNVPGECRCVLPEDIYSDDGATLLIEKGSTVTGTYGSTLKAGDSRIAVVWQRIKTVKGAVVDVESPAADGVGTMGVDGYVDNHWGKRIGAALLLSIIDDAVTIEVAKQSDGAATTARPTATTDTTKSMSEQVLSSTINIPPTISKNRSARLMIAVRRDLWFDSVYSIAKR